MSALSIHHKPGRAAIVAVYLAFAATVARTWVVNTNAYLVPGYMALYAVSLLLFTLFWWRPNRRAVFLHLYLAIHSVTILALLVLNPWLDFVNVLFVLLCYQAAIAFTGATRWGWVAILSVLTAGSLMVSLGLLYGLALALMPIAFGIVLAAYVAADEELERARDASAALLHELQATNMRLQEYLAQVEELTAMEERSRLARELHDSVSQTIFTIRLNVRSIQLLLQQNPARVKPQLEALQVLAQTALAQMRSLIAELCP